MPRANTTPVEPDPAQGPGAYLAIAVTLFGMAITATVVGTALYGSPEKSERAFRLMDHMKKTPDPAEPAPAPTARRRPRAAARDEAFPVR